MKALFLFFLLCFTLAVSYSQDIIVTNQGDTIECEITRVSEEFIHFTVYDQSGIILMRSRLPVTGVQYYTQGIREDEEEEADTPLSEENEEFFLSSLADTRLRLALNAGFTYQFGGYEWAPDSYRDQMQTLWNLGGEFHYFTSDNFGIGIKYSHAFTEANQDFMGANGSVVRFRDEQVRFSYVGVSMMYRNPYYDQAIQYFLSGGVVNYKTNLLLNGQPYYQQGDTFAVVFGLSYDMRIWKNIGAGLGAEILISNLSEIDDNGTLLPADFNISRVDLSLGLRVFK